MTKEQRENAVKWVAALRSGRYIQGKTRLKAEQDGAVKHCAVGALLEECGVPSVGHDSGWDGSKIYTFLYGESSHWWDVAENLTGLDPYSLDLDIPTRNDKGWTFKELADVIEKAIPPEEG